MGQHKRRDATVMVKILVSFFGTAIGAFGLYILIYSQPLGFYGNRAFGKLLGLGLILLFGSIWSLSRKKKSASRN